MRRGEMPPQDSSLNQAEGREERHGESKASPDRNDKMGNISRPDIKVVSRRNTLAETPERVPNLKIFARACGPIPHPRRSHCLKGIIDLARE